MLDLPHRFSEPFEVNHVSAVFRSPRLFDRLANGVRSGRERRGSRLWRLCFRQLGVGDSADSGEPHQRELAGTRVQGVKEEKELLPVHPQGTADR